MYLFKFIDLFAGMGGMRLALQQSLEKHNIEYECVLSSEIKRHAVEVYKSNFKDNVQGDICSIDTNNIPDFDMLLAGFPCQPFSSAGRQRGFEDTRGTLFFEIARILKDKRPKYFLLENVENLVRHDLSIDDKKKGNTIGKTLETILGVLEDLGYNVSWRVLAAEDYGVAQSRKRIYIVGCRDREISLEKFDKSVCVFGDIQEKGKECIFSVFTEKMDKYLKENNLEYSSLYGKSIRDKRGSSSNIHSWELGLRGDVNKNQICLLNRVITERRRKDLAKQKGVPLKDGVGLTLRELMNIYSGDDIVLDIADIVNKGYMKSMVLDSYPETIYDIVGGRLSYEFTKILDPRKPSITLVATDVSHVGVVDGNGLRRLTLLEGLRLNGYPDDFKFDISYSKGMDLLGNTVVVPVVKMLCDRILFGE